MALRGRHPLPVRDAAEDGTRSKPGFRSRGTMRRETFRLRVQRIETSPPLLYTGFAG